MYIYIYIYILVDENHQSLRELQAVLPSIYMDSPGGGKKKRLCSSTQSFMPYITFVRRTNDLYTVKNNDHTITMHWFHLI